MQIKFNKNVYRYLLALTVFTIALGTIVYHIVEKFSWVDSYYFSVITLATVGYGDLTPHTNFGKIFTTFYIFIGVGIITTFISYTLRRRANKIEKKRRSKS
jgi:voltage-gated potassium channel